MNEQKAFNRSMLLFSLLVSGLMPSVSSAVCLQDSSGAVWEFNGVGGSGPVFGKIEIPGVCPPSPFSGSSFASGTTVEVGVSAYFNTALNGCIPQATLAATLDEGALQGTGTLLRFFTDGTFVANSTDVTQCANNISERSETDVEDAEAFWLDEPFLLDE